MQPLPNIGTENAFASNSPEVKKRSKPFRSRRNKTSSENQEPRGIEFPQIPELVREDVYLMDNKRRRVHANLLANSLTAKLRRNMTAEMDVQPNAMQKIRRDSLKDFMHLDILNKQYTSEMNWEANRLDKESFQIIRRHNQLKRQSANQQKQFERMEAMTRSRSGLSSASLPRLVDSAASNLEYTPDIREDEHSGDYPEFAGVDKDDSSHVKVFKLGGIFRPQNKYSSTIDLDIPPKVKSNASHSNNLKESLLMADSATPVDLPPKSRMSRMSRKGLRVTWSSNSQYFDGNRSALADSPTNTSGRNSRVDSRDDGVRTPSTTASFKSTKSDSYLIKKSFTKGRSNVDTVGLRWKVNPTAGNEEQQTMIAPPQRPVRRSSGRLSHNLNPVTTAMDREGRSPEKIRWHVQKIQSSNTMEMYQTWLKKVELLKGNSESHINNIPNRANLSVMTQPA